MLNNLQPVCRSLVVLLAKALSDLSDDVIWLLSDFVACHAVLPAVQLDAGAKLAAKKYSTAWHKT